MRHLLPFTCLLLWSCGKKTETVHPSVHSITESIYASGNLEGKNQYEVFSAVSGIADRIYVSECDSVMPGSPLLSVRSETQELTRENAQLTSANAALSANEGRLREAAAQLDLAVSRMRLDSLQHQRQKRLWEQKVGSKVELEQAEMAYQNSRTATLSARERYAELKRQLNLASAQARNMLRIAAEQENDYLLKSRIAGEVYSVDISAGEMVTPQRALAIIGDNHDFVLKMQVDEFDIARIGKGQKVIVALNSYQDTVYEAVVTRIYPLMNQQSRSFLVEAQFVTRPEVLYPQITFEANIVVQTRQAALLVPREYLLGDSIAFKKSGEKVRVKTGLKDYQMIEILSGLTLEDELILPAQ
jgi:multidrug efflux pump subunit AcrA (membrane-fusion protein)